METIGVSRNLTEVFNLLRSNAHTGGFSFDNPTVSFKNNSAQYEKLSLISLEEGGEHQATTDCPIWVHTGDEIEFEFGRIKSRLEELASIQRKHISRPNFGDETFEIEEKQMEQMTEQITSVMNHCQRLISLMASQSVAKENSAEKRLRENCVSGAASVLSNLANEFRNRQNKYLKDIKARSRNVDDFLITTGHTDELQWGELIDVTPTQEYTMDQIQQILMNEKEVKERENEVLTVNSSIRDLNHLFKDLSDMIVDQGTILDRIDYNVEQSSVRVSNAVNSVKKAEKSQRSSKKMSCICFLSIAIIFVLILIISFKL